MGSNNKPYLDTCMMGIGTSVLGYNNSELNKFVFQKLTKQFLQRLIVQKRSYLQKN